MTSGSHDEGIQKAYPSPPYAERLHGKLENMSKWDYRKYKTKVSPDGWIRKLNNSGLKVKIVRTDRQNPSLYLYYNCSGAFIDGPQDIKAQINVLMLKLQTMREKERKRNAYF